MLDVLTEDESLKRAVVLVMDDSSILRQVISEMLLSIGIDHILEAESTALAVQQIKSKRISLAILDIRVPGTPELRNGIDLLRWIRANFLDIPVIMVTNFDQPVYRTVCSQLGASYFFDKSNDLQNLPTAVSELLKHVEH